MLNHDLQNGSATAPSNPDDAVADSVYIYEDSTMPTEPSLYPRETTVNADTITLTVETASTDVGGAITYEVWGGTDYSWKETTGTSALTFNLEADITNDLCVRAKDGAGNLSSEICSTVTEQSTMRISENGSDESKVDIGGEWIVFTDNNSYQSS